jgi:hypothetical protein
MRPSVRIVLLLALAVFSGCAGLSTKKTPPLDNPLRHRVPESFHFSLQDAATRRHLVNVDPNSLPPEERLEVLLLRQLAAVSSEEGLVNVFDRFWEEEEEIRELVNRPERRERYVYPLVEVYYVLSAASAASWQQRTSERLYEETLRHIKPLQLSGYALHFYTLALLKNGKVDAAMSFLKRLEFFTSPSDYLRDLTVALAYTTNRGSGEVTCRLMAQICWTAVTHNLELPEDELKVAIDALKKSNNLELARNTLLPVIQKNPQLQSYTFVELLKKQQQTTPSEWQSTGMAIAPERNAKQSPMRSYEKEELTTSSSVVQPRKVRVDVQVIKACKRSSYMDAALVGLEKSLRETLNFPSFRLAAKKVLHLELGERGVLALPQGHLLRVIPRSLRPEISRIELTILNGDLEVFNTLVESVDGGTTTIGGPQDGGEVLLIRITTFILEAITGTPSPQTIADRIGKECVSSSVILVVGKASSQSENDPRREGGLRCDHHNGKC